MTILLNPTDEDIVLFTDTLREHQKTYKFIDDFEKYEGIKVHRAYYTHQRAPGLQGFDALTKWKTYLPNRVRRICTEELKIVTAKRYLRNLGVRKFENFIGFRADEMHRVERSSQRYVNVFPKYPLVEKGITKEMVNQYWLTKPYTLEIPSILGNCDLCFLKGKDNIIKILQMYPELAEPWIRDEENAGAGRTNKPTFIKDISYKELLHIAQSQKTLFDLDDALPAYNCSYTSF
ncbi:MAG: hypothetical protein JWQ54_1815 [Mucilaginibacter sp.]|nr:hypothetical protein [Mucilaginibacter sp.]